MIGAQVPTTAAGMQPTGAVMVRTRYPAEDDETLLDLAAAAGARALADAWIDPLDVDELAVSDAAGAAVLRRGDPGAHGGSGLIDAVVHSTARYSDLSTVSPRTGWVKSKPELNEIAVDHVLRAVEELLDRNGLSADEL